MVQSGKSSSDDYSNDSLYQLKQNSGGGGKVGENRAGDSESTYPPSADRHTDRWSCTLTRSRSVPIIISKVVVVVTRDVNGEQN